MAKFSWPIKIPHARVKYSCLQLLASIGVQVRCMTREWLPQSEGQMVGFSFFHLYRFAFKTVLVP
jgi:hypothetical protein